jgi:hypothetical protein
MGASEEILNAEIERAKRDLARDVEALRREASAASRKLLMAVAALAAAYAAFRVIRFVVRRRGQPG